MKKGIYIAVLCLMMVLSGYSGELSGYAWVINSVRTGDTHLFIIDPDTGDSLNLTPDSKALNRYPMWSPDGRSIAFTSDRDGTFNLFLIDGNGRNLRQLTREKSPSVVYMPNWQSDSQQIIFGVIKSKDELLIASMDPDSDKYTTLGMGLDPCISPDSKTIIFTRKGKKGNCLFAMDADGKNVRQLTSHENDLGGMHPFWTPDGQKILFADQVGKVLEIFSCDPDGKNIQQLTKLGKMCTSPSMSPDGRWIAFRVASYAFWKDPDESKRVYQEKPADLRPVYIMKADGSNPHIVETLHYQCTADGSRPSWKPR